MALHDVDAALSASQSRDPQWAARFRVQKAHILMMRGAYTDSLRLLQDPLPPALVRTDSAVQRGFVQALDYDGLQQLDAADHVLSQAETLSAAINSSLGASVAQTRGILELDRRNYDKSASAFRTAAGIAREQKLATAELNALANLGNVAMWQEHYDEAIDRFRAALDRSRALNAIGPESKSLGNLGWSYSDVGDFDNAEASFKEAQAKAAQAGLVEDQTYWLTGLGEAYFHLARYQEAQATEEQALTLARQHDDKASLVNCLNTLAEIALARSDFDRAERFSKEALQIESSGTDQPALDFTRVLAGRAAAPKHFEEAEALFQKVANDPSAPTPYKWEALGWLGVIYHAQNQPAKAERQFKLVLTTIQNAQRTLRREDFRVSFLSGAILFYEAYVNFLVDQNRPLDALKIADLSRSQALEQRLGSQSASSQNRSAQFDPRTISRRLNTTLLFYWLGQTHWLGKQRSYLWIVTPSTVSLLPLPPTTEIDTLVKSYRESFAGPRDPLESANSDGRKLYAALVQPAEKLLPKNGRIFIFPDGSLNSLNFETLIVDAPKPHYWIEDATILTANSLSRLARRAPLVPPKSGNLLVMGDAVSASPDFPPLPQSGKEINLVERYFDASQRLEFTGKAATPDAFLSNAPEKFSYLHFATHGTASSLRPLESAVILSPDGNSYKLYARDVLNHPLNAYLVTISACNGAGVKTYAGEGLVGLSWAFLRAGARNVVAGLWEVSNASTPQLMDDLYKGLSQGNDPATALRNAKLNLVHSSGNYRKPFYWAPFLLYSGS